MYLDTRGFWVQEWGDDSVLAAAHNTAELQRRIAFWSEDLTRMHLEHSSMERLRFPIDNPIPVNRQKFDGK